MQEQDLLILGAGWTATFLIPLLQEKKRRFAATTTDGRDVAGYHTIEYKFDSEADDAIDRIGRLPLAKSVLVTFPLTTAKQVKFLVEEYTKTHRRAAQDVQFVQLGSTGIWQIEQESIWVDRKSPYNKTNERAVAEDALIHLGGCVLNLAGLWGGERQPRNWQDRVAKTKEDVKSKKSLHMIHGLDVSRAVVAVIDDWKQARGQRWMLTDGFVYDWYSLFMGWANQEDGTPTKQARWVQELMQEEQILALPRSMEVLQRCYSSRDFWDTFDLTPAKARI
ncbi:hypothetical protein AMS68_001809 [Peltaster fructicola]|uniref:NmrA-like domain-containing protein n=1 Tax=Peltaster fructicola TaxID=286661 RepID=A0A6H0XNF7_9PEZI|nr:hypothetical protein AMS68_001809 [Peltaster fructicola]